MELGGPHYKCSVGGSHSSFGGPYTKGGVGALHQQEAPRPPVYTVGPPEPLYQEIGPNRHKQKVEGEPSWAPKPRVVYGVITAKEVAKFVPSKPLVRPEPT